MDMNRKVGVQALRYCPFTINRILFKILDLAYEIFMKSRGANCNTNKLILLNQTETKMAFRLFLLFPV